MRPPISVQSLVLVVLASAACAGDPPSAPSMAPASEIEAVTYGVVPLGSLGGNEGEASDMLDGRIVGYSERADGRYIAFLWENGVMRELGALPTGLVPFSRATGLNAAGQIVGFSHTRTPSFGFAEHAVLWQNNTILDLGTLGGRDSRALAVNGQGLIVGSAQNAAGFPRAVLWRNGVIRDLGTLGGQSSAAADVNASGVIVGSSETASGSYKAFIWRDGTMRALPTLSGGGAFAHAINDAGDVVGESMLASGESRAVLWKDGRIVNLGALPGDQVSTALDIDQVGRITGYSQRRPVTGARTRVFIWDKGVLRNLGNSTAKPNRALGISPAGHIVGSSAGAPVMWRRQ